MVAEVRQNRTWQLSGSIQKWLNWVGPILGLVLVILTFSLLMESPARYLSPFNLRIVLAQTVIVAIGAIGMTLIIISGGIDLSVGSTYGLVGVAFSILFAPSFVNVGPVPAALFCFALGTVIGLLNGVLVTVLRVPSFIATLTMYVVRIWVHASLLNARSPDL